MALVANTIAGSSNGTTVTTSAIDTTGATLLVLVEGSQTGTATVSDSYGNTWTALTRQVMPGVGSDGAVRLHYVANPIVGTGHTFAASGVGISIAVQAHDDVILVLPFDDETGANQLPGVSPAIDTGTLTPAQDGDLFVSGYISWGTFVLPGVYDPFNPPLDIIQVDELYHFSIGSACYYQSTAAAQSATWELPGGFSQPAAAVLATFKTISTPVNPAPIDYENPCQITEPRIFATVNTGTEVIKVSPHPLRDSAAMGGFAEPRMLEVGPITRVASDPVTGAWSAQTASMTWADTDRRIRGLSEERTSLRNCDAEIYITSNSQRLAGLPPRVLFAGKVYSDTADANLSHSSQLNDLIGVNYSLFSEEKQIPQRTIQVNWFPNAPEGNIGLGEPIVGGRRAPLNPVLNGEGITEAVYVGQVRINGTHATPTGTDLASVVAALEASRAAGTLYVDYGSRIGYADANILQGMGSVPSDYDALAHVIGYADLDALLAETAYTGGDVFEACVVASHAISEVLDGLNTEPSIWVDDVQVPASDIGTSVWCPQIPGDTSWASDIGSDLFTDVLGADGVTRRYTLILFSTGSSYATDLQGGARVHLDCVGLEDEGDGTGVPLTDYFDLYRHVLVNFILQDYQSGAWLPVPQFTYADGSTLIDRVDPDSFTNASTVAALSLPGGRIGSFTIKDRASVRDVVATFNLCGGCRLAEDDYGRLRVQILDLRREHFLTDQFGVPTEVLRDKIDILPGMWVEPKPEWQVNLLRYQYGLNGYSGEFERGADGAAAPTQVEDATSQTRDGVLKKTIAFPFVSDDGTATDVANYYMQLFKDLPHVAHYARRGVCGLKDDVLDGISLTHFNGFGSGGWNERSLWVLSKTFIGKTVHCEFTALDVEGRLVAFETTEPDPLMLDPVAVEALFDDVSGEPLFADV